MSGPMSASAEAYLAEYGDMPTDRMGQDRYSAFRFGYEAGMRAGRNAAYLDVLKAVQQRKEAGQ